MNQTWRLLTLIVLLFAACEKGEEPAASSTEGEATEQAEQTAQATEAEGEAEAAPSEAAETPPPETPPSADGETAAPAAGFEGLRDGYFVSERFNVRFRLPGGWQRTHAGGEDSMTFEGPAGIQMIVANSQSVQLIDTNFTELNDRVSFDNVNILPDRTEAAPLNGLPGYRVEGDALLRGEDLPIYFISQAVSLPGEPIMATIFIPGDNYFEHSDAMKAVLDSIEALDLRPE
jgi:hypothetical protein